MFCVIQEVETKKTVKGYPKSIEVDSMTISFGGTKEIIYSWNYGVERFERPVKKAYRISIHQSYRDKGKVKKRQYVLCTVNYYDFAENWFSIYEYCDERISVAADRLAVNSEDIYDLVEAKTSLLKERIQKEFHETEEYRTHQKQKKLINDYHRRKKRFSEEYEVSENEYDKCYDVFGELRNSEYLETIKANYKTKKEYERKNRSYYENNYGNYSGWNGSSYCENFSNNYSYDDREILKQFYRTLSKKFHPDVNPDEDTSKQMQLLNQLKKEWGL